MLFSKAQFGLIGNTKARHFKLMTLRTKVLLAALICLVVGVIVATMPGSAANPSSGTLTDVSGPLLSRTEPITSRVGTSLVQNSSPTASGLPRFFNYVSPFGDGAGEPSIGSNWGSEQISHNTTIGGITNNIPNGGNSHYFGGFFPYMLHVVWDDCPSPANATFTKKKLTLASSPHVFGDPILFTDNAPGRPNARTLVAQLEGLTPAGSAIDITDDDGATFTPSEGGAPSRIDHETIGGGPFHAPLPGGGTPVYPHAIYYCSQSVADAACELSVDGGVTFGPAVTIYTTADCGGLHGHIKVAPDGTAYVPNNACGGTDLIGHVDGQQAVIVSENNGVTWSIRKIPESTTKSDDDSSVGVATDSNTIYEGMQSGDGHPRIAVSHDKGVTWSTPFDVGTTVVSGGPVLNTAFPAVVAGDGGTTTGRAAFAFYGTETGGSDYNQPGFAGVWYLYIATTFDGGVTWTTQNITPGDPIQRGGICGSGTCRNLLDFFDATIDKQGRVLIGYDDGCIGSCVAGGANSFTAQATIARQAGGKRMFASKDPVEPALPEAPGLSGVVNSAGTAVDLSWPVPDNGGATITAYNVYRKPSGGSFSLRATVNETTFTDTTFTAGSLYRVTAVNSQGEGPFCHDITPETGPTDTACIEPGIKVIDDTNADGSDADSGQNTPPDGSVNVRKLRIAEPFLGTGVHKLIFTLQVAPSLLTSPPPNSQWLIIWNALAPNANFDRRYVAMVTDAMGATSFDFGKFGVPLDATNPNQNANTPVKLGTAVGTYNQATGVIRIELPTSNAENVQPGQTLAGINVRTYFNRPDYPGFQRSQNNASDITANGSYTLVGNDVGCRVNQLPTAVLTADKTSGTAPLLVNFDGSGSSDPDPGDSISSYTFNFGDGTEVTQTSPTVPHTYDSTHPCPGSGDVRTCVATLTVKDQSGAQSANTATWNVTVTTPPPPSQCVEDTDAQKIAYDNGWHTVKASNASNGTYHLNTGKDVQHALTFTFNLQSATGSLKYFYATSSKGGTAQVLIDHLPPPSNGTINYLGGSGQMRDPAFGALATYSITGMGMHTFELINLTGPAYVDQFCITNGGSSTVATAGPGTTTTSTSALALGQSLLQNVLVPSNALGFSVAAEADVNVPYTLVVIDPSGKVLGTVNSSANGIASVSMPVSTSGLYVIKLVNVGVGPVNIWTAATPFVQW